MDFDFDGLRIAFADQSEVVLDVVSASPDLDAPTALGDWSCAVLVGHVSAAIEIFWRWRGERLDSTVELDAVSWWDAADPDVNDSWAQRYAAKRSHRELRDGLAAAVDKALGVLADSSPGERLVSPDGAVWARLDTGLATRVFELTVHGHDLAAATNSQASMAVSAIEVSASVLDACLGGDRPQDIDNDHDWVLFATGRRPHVDPRLPVVS